MMAAKRQAGARGGGRRIQLKRMAQALAIVAATIVAVPVAGVVSGAQAADHSEETAAGIWDFVSAGLSDEGSRGDAFSFLDRVEQAADAAGLPSEAFRKEAGFPPGAYEARSSADGSVAGCAIEGGADEAFAAIRAVLDEKGWSCVPLQGMQGATFTKETGVLRWMLVTCTQAGDSTAAVYRMIDAF